MTVSTNASPIKKNSALTLISDLVSAATKLLAVPMIPRNRLFSVQMIFHSRFNKSLARLISDVDFQNISRSHHHGIEFSVIQLGPD